MNIIPLEQKLKQINYSEITNEDFEKLTNETISWADSYASHLAFKAHLKPVTYDSIESLELFDDVNPVTDGASI